MRTVLCSLVCNQKAFSVWGSFWLVKVWLIEVFAKCELEKIFFEVLKEAVQLTSSFKRLETYFVWGFGIFIEAEEGPTF